MIVLPKNYKQIYPCVNECGFTSKIYANLEYTEAYKIYKDKFNYKEDKFNAIKSFENEHFLTPQDIIFIEDEKDSVGYQMKFDNSISIPKLLDADLNKLISAALILPLDIADLSSNKFLITDPNPDNIIFGDNYKFVDTYSFLQATKFSVELIKQKNTTKANTSIIMGLFGFYYLENIIKYFKNNNPKYLDKFLKLQSSDSNFIYDILSLIQEATQQNSLQKTKKILLQ